jgi:hypothetical protein
MHSPWLSREPSPSLASLELPLAVTRAYLSSYIAERLESVVRAVARLTAEGLSRHDSIHAIATVLAEHINELFNAKADEEHSAAIYSAAVERLTARGWRGG